MFRSSIRSVLIGCLTLLLGLVAVVIPAQAVQAASSPALEVKNAGFEEPPVDGAIPGWRQTYGVGASDLSYEVTSAAKYSGNNSLRLNDAGASVLGIDSDRFGISEGVAYSASAMFLVEREKLTIYLQFFNEAGTRISNVATSLDPTGGQWVKGAVSGVAPEGAVTASVLLYSSTVTKGAGYIDDVKVEVNPIGTFEHLGEPITNFIHQDSAIAEEQGKLVSYTVVRGANDSTVFAIIDVLEAKVIKKIPMPGVSGVWAIEIASDGKVYAGSSTNGSLYQYTPGSDHVVNLGRLGQETHIWSMVAGKDGKVYAGTYPNAHVYEYDPAANQIRDIGRVHPTEKYVRSLAYDTERDVIYAGLGSAQAALIKIDAVTDAISEDILPKLLPDVYQNYGNTYRLAYALGKVFVRLTNPGHLLIIDAETETIEFYDGSNTSIAIGASVVTMPGDDNKVFFGGTILRSYNVKTREFKVEYPDPAMRWLNFFAGKFVNINDPDWPGYTFVAAAEKGKFMLYNLQTGKIETSQVTNYGAPVLIQSLHTGFDGNIYIGGFLGATGFTSYVPAEDTFTAVEEFGQVETVSSVHDKLYIGTYSFSRIHEYDPTQPWSATNPRMVADLARQGQDRPFASIGVDSLNKLYVGSVADYGTHQGALTIYDVSTRELEVRKDMVKNQGIASLAYKDGFIYGGTTIYGGLGTSGPIEKEGKLFVFDTATNTKVMEIVPVPGRKVVSGLLAGPDGMIWGVAEDYIFKFDPITREIVYKAAKLSRYGTTSVWLDAFLETGKDGNVYGTNRQKRFFMIKPDTMGFVPIKDGAGNYLSQDHYGNFYMSNDSHLWKYSLPADVESVTAMLNRASDAGQIPHPIHMQLTNSLNQAVHQQENGHSELAVKHLQDFLKHLHYSAFESSVMTEAKLPLDQQVRTLISNWE